MEQFARPGPDTPDLLRAFMRVGQRSLFKKYTRAASHLWSSSPADNMQVQRLVAAELPIMPIRTTYQIGTERGFCYELDKVELHSLRRCTAVGASAGRTAIVNSSVFICLTDEQRNIVQQSEYFDTSDIATVIYFADAFAVNDHVPRGETVLQFPQ